MNTRTTRRPSLKYSSTETAPSQSLQQQPSLHNRTSSETIGLIDNQVQTSKGNIEMAVVSNTGSNNGTDKKGSVSSRNQKKTGLMVEENAHSAEETKSLNGPNEMVNTASPTANPLKVECKHQPSDTELDCLLRGISYTESDVLHGLEENCFAGNYHVFAVISKINHDNRNFDLSRLSISSSVVDDRRITVKLDISVISNATSVTDNHVATISSNHVGTHYKGVGRRVFLSNSECARACDECSQTCCPLYCCHNPKSCMGKFCNFLSAFAKFVCCPCYMCIKSTYNWLMVMAYTTELNGSLLSSMINDKKNLRTCATMLISFEGKFYVLTRNGKSNAKLDEMTLAKYLHLCQYNATQHRITYLNSKSDFKSSYTTEELLSVMSQ